MKAGTAVQEAVKNSSLVDGSKLRKALEPTFKINVNTKNLTESFNKLRGVDVMADYNFVKEAVRPTLANNAIKAVNQYGNSTHESLFGMAFC